jgi:hypothetical protein
MKLTTGVDFIKLFWYNLHSWRHNLSQNIRQYVDSGINYAEKSFMKLTTGVDFIKLFGHYLSPQRHGLSQNIRQYVDSSVNDAKKV